MLQLLEKRLLSISLLAVLHSGVTLSTSRSTGVRLRAFVSEAAEENVKGLDFFVLPVC